MIQSICRFRQFEFIIPRTFLSFISMQKENSSPQMTPDEFQEHFHQACILQEAGSLKESLEIYDDLLSVFPGSPLLHFNCGLAYFDQQNFSKAETHYSKAAAMLTDDPDIHYNRGLNFRRLHRYKDAAISFENAFKAGDTSIDTLYNLALCNQDIGNFSEAGRLYDIILSKDSTHQSCLNNFAYLCHKSGDTKRAESLYRQLLTINPGHLAAQHMLSSLTGTTPDSAPIEYVESIFDNYANDFEHSLIENLQYKTPETLYDFYFQVFKTKSQHRCLDLGCGTGLAGEQFKNICIELTGIDISQKMLAIAKRKHLYDQLIKDDIIHFLQAANQKYNLILAADVFTYMGDLEKMFTECSSSITKSGILLFSVEEARESDKGFELKHTGRFGHSAAYIKSLCQQTGWTILDHQLSNLRQEKGEWIKGHLYLLQH